jgi:hypothetical protein
MSITLNTYGIRSINSASFNASGARGSDGSLTEYIPLSTRDRINTFLRVNNLVLNILGYIPVVKQTSGCIRMGIGISIIVLTLAVGSPTAGRGLIVGRWYTEALLTGLAQVARGALEAFVPFSYRINLSLDVIGTIYNLATEISLIQYDGPRSLLTEHEIDEINQRPLLARRQPPYSDPEYGVFSFLYLV